MNNENFIVKENSRYAWLAAKKMKAPALAMVLGKTIHLHYISKEDLLRDKKLLKHELCHMQQFRQYGFADFLVKYPYPQGLLKF